MTDYWKSNAKKFCEICQVWMQDNKISVERHETGAKHKAMLQQKLRSIGERQKEKELEQLTLQSTLARMEQAALASMKSDKGQLPKAPSAAPKIKIPDSRINKPTEQDIARDLQNRKRQRDELLAKSQKSEFWKDDSQIDWVRSETKEGETPYYWNIYTAETQWETPDRFYTAEEYTEKYNALAGEARLAASKAEEEFLKTFEEPTPSVPVKEPAPEYPKANKRAKREMEKAVKEAQKAIKARPTIMPGRVGLDEIPLPEPSPVVSRVAPQITDDDLSRIPVSLIPQPKVEENSRVKADPDGDFDPGSAPQSSEPVEAPRIFVPPPKPHGPYGAWVPVEKKPEKREPGEEGDQNEVNESLHVVKQPEEDFQFGEKTASVSSSKKKTVEFRKRKTSSRNHARTSSNE
uniref:WW domain-binding protein 4 n=1 Tax=Steinernema glaseri TaxID=37863 RepID=A0A1I7YWA1_9BILA